MDSVSQVTLADAVKQITQTILEQLASHNVQGAALLKEGLDEIAPLVDHSTEVFNLIKTLAPLFGQIYAQVKKWIQSAIPHLEAIFDWAKNIWNSLFGHHSSTKAA